MKPSEFEHLDCLNALPAWDDCTFEINAVRDEQGKLHVEIDWYGPKGSRTARVPLAVPAELGDADGVWEAILKHVEAGQ